MEDFGAQFYFSITLVLQPLLPEQTFWNTTLVLQPLLPEHTCWNTNYFSSHSKGVPVSQGGLELERNQLKGECFKQEGYRCPDLLSFLKHGLIKNFQFQGWGWFSNFRGFSWLWVLCLSNQLKGECF